MTVSEIQTTKQKVQIDVVESMKSVFFFTII